MFNPKIKGLFIDVSEFSILAARTSGFKVPMVVEELAEFTLTAEHDAEEVRSFLEHLVDFGGSGYYVSRVGAYPDGRFVRCFEAESASKAKDLRFLSEALKSEFNIDPETNSVAILDARDGSDFDVKSTLSKRVVFCGAPTINFQKEQDRLLEYGIYPERLELSTTTTLGGVIDYAHFINLRSPILFFELSSECANIFIINQGQIDVARPVSFGLNSIYPLLQRELGLKDEVSARKLFFSNTFDFAEIGPKLLRRMTKELQASTGFYEVQTGLTVENVFIGVLPKNLSWVSKTVSESLGLDVLQPDLEKWLETLKVKLADGVDVANLGPRWMGLFSLMGEFHLREEGASEKG